MRQGEEEESNLINERVWAARWPREWVLTAAIGEAAQGGPATRRREIGGRECDNI